MNPQDTELNEQDQELESMASILDRVEQDRMGARYKPADTGSDLATDGTPPSLEDEDVTLTPDGRVQTVPLQAQIAERRKRQDAEARLAELEKQAGVQREPNVDDSHQAVALRLNMSEELAQASHADYDEVVSPLLQMLEAKPELLQDILHEPHPAEILYRLGKQWQLVDRAGGIDSIADQQFRAGYDSAMAEQDANMRAYKAKMEAELLPPSFAEVSAPGMREDLEVRDTPLHVLLGD